MTALSPVEPLLLLDETSELVAVHDEIPVDGLRWLCDDWSKLPLEALPDELDVPLPLEPLDPEDDGTF